MIGSRRSVGEERLKRLTIAPTSRQRTTTQTRRVVRPQQGASKERARLLRQSVREAPTQRVVNRPEAGGSDFDVLKQAKEGVWYRRVEDKEGVALIRVNNDDVIINRDQRTKEDLTLKDKEHNEGFWYRRFNDGDGVSRLVRVKNVDAILNGDQRTKEVITVENKEWGDGFWYRRVNDEDGAVRLVRVKNDDIIIKSLKTFKRQTTTRTRTSRAV